MGGERDTLKYSPTKMKQHFAASLKKNKMREPVIYGTAGVSQAIKTEGRARELGFRCFPKAGKLPHHPYKCKASLRGI